MEQYFLPKTYDVVVVGAGHAGVEAALAAARLGAEVLLVTQNLDTIGQMSCNPAIGGSAKGHIVREIDALGGAMGLNADATGIQFRLLNRSKGPSVWAPRAQCDKRAYQLRLKCLVEHQSTLDVKQGGAIRLLLNREKVAGICLDFGLNVLGRSVIITAGTFLCGLLHVGDHRQRGGRMADASSPLSDSLRALGFMTGRFKTGTPCRLSSSSIDFASCVRQDGDDPPQRFSNLPIESELGMEDTAANRMLNGKFHVEQLPCWITTTTSATHDIIRQNLHRSPLYSGRIEGTGPRYCPSIEDKVVRFANKDRHQIFLEPEGRRTGEFYVNGLSTSLPYDVQVEVIHSIPGLERAEIMRPGYAVEYDYFPPIQVYPTLETKTIEGLYFAGQINGTSGYEEAAAQGLMAGANAALKVASKPPFVLDRSEGYIGVLIDDLTSKGTHEPYRMFTSRAEHRLLLRHDTADLRLTPKAELVGLVDHKRGQVVREKAFKLQEARESALTVRVTGHALLHLMRQPGFNAKTIPEALYRKWEPEIWELLGTDMKYEGYIKRQNEQARALDVAADRSIPANVDYPAIPGLRTEARQKLMIHRPSNLRQAQQISGVTASDLGVLNCWLSKG